MTGPEEPIYPEPLKGFQAIIRHRPTLDGGKQCWRCYGWGFLKPDGTVLPPELQVYRVKSWKEIQPCRACAGTGKLRGRVPL